MIINDSRIETALAAALILSACSEGYMTAEGDGSMVSMGAPKLLTERIIVEENLRPYVTIGDNPVTMRRFGSGWQGTFILPNALSATLRVVWIENVNSIDLPLAESQQFITSTDQNVLISEYQTGGFDFDEDGQSNFAERIAGTDPFVFNEPIPAPGTHQRDCRERNGEYESDSHVPLSDLVSLRTGDTKQLSIDPNFEFPLSGGGNFVFFPIWLREDAELIVEMSDIPGTRTILLSDVSLENDSRLFGFRFPTEADILPVELQAGIYCFRSEEGTADFTGSIINLRAEPIPQSEG